MSRDNNEFNQQYGDGADDTPTSFFKPQSGQQGDASQGSSDSERAWSKAREDIFKKIHGDSDEDANVEGQDFVANSTKDVESDTDSGRSVEGFYPSQVVPKQSEVDMEQEDVDEDYDDDGYYPEGSFAEEEPQWKRRYLAIAGVAGVVLVSAVVALALALNNASKESLQYANQAASSSAEGLSKDKALERAENERDKALGDVQRLTKERDEARERTSEASREASELRSKVSDLEKERADVERAKGDIAKKDEEIRRAKDDLDSKERELSQMEGELNRLNRELSNSRTATTVTRTVEAPARTVTQTVPTTVYIPVPGSSSGGAGSAVEPSEG